MFAIDICIFHCQTKIDQVNGIIIGCGSYKEVFRFDVPVDVLDNNNLLLTVYEGIPGDLVLDQGTTARFSVKISYYTY
jgi:hypothetical protein